MLPPFLFKTPAVSNVYRSDFFRLLGLIPFNFFLGELVFREGLDERKREREEEIEGLYLGIKWPGITLRDDFFLKDREDPGLEFLSRMSVIVCSDS